MSKIYDTIGIGFGPANIAVAIAMEELGYDKKVLFLEKESSTVWQKDMLFEGSDIQNHPLRDLVTPANPRSKYTFTNFLFEQGRLFEHFNLGMHFPFRVEYGQYITWVASHFQHLVKYDTTISSITVEEDKGEYIYKIILNDGVQYLAKSIVVATGRTPYIPNEFVGLDPNKVIHLTKYLSTINSLKEEDVQSIAVVGGSQSAIEILLHASERFPQADILGVTKSFGYRMKDVSPFTGEVYFPEFVDLFYKSSKKNKERLINDLHFTNYSATDLDVLDELYRKMYQQKIQGKQKIFIERSADITKVIENGKIEIHFDSIEKEKSSVHDIDLVILATGFKNIGTKPHQEKIPKVFMDLSRHLSLNSDECIDVYPNYRVKMKPYLENAYCFMNGFCESSHGMGDAGSFSLLALRSRAIVSALKKKEESFQLENAN